MMGKIWTWTKEHPWYAAAIVFVVGVLLYLLLFRKSGGTVAQANPYDAYYGALAASTASGNSLAGVQNQTAAQTAQAQISAGAAVDIARIQADTQNQQTAATVQVANTASSLQATLAGIMASLGIAQTNAAADVAKAQTTASVAQTGMAVDLARYQTTIGGIVASTDQPGRLAVANQSLLERLVSGSPDTGTALRNISDYASILGPLQNTGVAGKPFYADVTNGPITGSGGTPGAIYNLLPNGSYTQNY